MIDPNDVAEALWQTAQGKKMFDTWAEVPASSKEIWRGSYDAFVGALNRGGYGVCAVTPRQPTRATPGGDGVPSSRQEIALHFCTHTWTASERSIDPTIACEPCCKKADTIIRALASAPSETVGPGELETEVEELRALVGKLNGGAEMQELMRLNNGLADKVRNLTTLLDQQLGTPCEQIRHAQEVERLQALVLPTADRDAIREALKEGLRLVGDQTVETHTQEMEIVAKLTAALALIGEG